MLCNGACHLSNDTFLAVQQDVYHRVALVTSSVAHPVVTHTVNRSCFFGVSPTPPCEEEDNGRVEESPQHTLISSPDGLRVVALNSAGDHHYLLEPIHFAVTEFTTPHGEVAIAGAWVPTSPHLFVVLFASAQMMTLDMSKASIGSVVVASPMRDLARIVTENMQYKEVYRVNALAEQRILQQHTPTAADLRKPSPILTHFVHMTLVPESDGLPTMMLLLTREGAVYAVKLSSEGLPAEPPPEVELERDTKVICSSTQQQQQTRLPHLRELCVHQLFAAAAEMSSDAVVVGQHCLDRRTGYYAVFAVFQDGVLRGKFVQEADLLSRDATISAFHFAIHFGPEVPLSSSTSRPNPTANSLSPRSSALDPVLPTPSAIRPSRVQIESCGNAFLVRYAAEAFLIGFPQWDDNEAAWVVRSQSTPGSKLLPVLSPIEFPHPLALRLPYKTAGYSVAVGIEDLLLFPQVSDAGLPVIVESVTALLKTAIYSEITSSELTATTGPDINGKFANLYMALSASHRAGLGVSETGPHAETNFTRRSAELLASIEAVERAVSDEEKRLDARQAALRARFVKLQERHHSLSSHMHSMKDRVSTALLHRGGIKSLVETNDVLGRIQEVLDRVEEDTLRMQS